MNDKPASVGPFLRRRWFEEHEFDDIAKEALRCLLPKESAPFDIELFVDMEF